MKTEIWKKHPDIEGMEVSTLGNVRILDRPGSRENRTYSKKGRVLKQCYDKNGYMRVGITIDRKWTMKLVHRLVAQTFIPNPDNLPCFPGWSAADRRAFLREFSLPELQ